MIGIYYGKCLLTEKLLSGAVRTQIDTCIRDIFYEKVIKKI